MKLRSRKEEGALLIVQNNEARTVTVEGGNETACALLGYREFESGMPLHQVLGKKAIDILEEDLEFDDTAEDLCQILAKHRRLTLRHHHGHELTMECNIVRVVATDRHYRFRLIMSQPDWKARRQSLSHVLLEGLRGYEVHDPASGLPDYQTMVKHINLTESCLSGQDMEACVVYMQFEKDEPVKAERVSLDEITTHVAGVISRNLRADDTIGRIAEDALGIVLIEINSQTVHLALTRLPHLIASDPMILDDGTSYVPRVRQSCVLLEDQEGADVIHLAAKLLDDDPNRDMVMLRDASRSMGLSTR